MSPSHAAEARTSPIERVDIERKLRELQGGVTETRDAVKVNLVAVGACVAVGVVAVAFMWGRRKGRKRSTVVEIRRTPGAQAVTRITLERPSGQISLSRPSGKVATLSQTGQPDHRIALPVRQLHECIAEELRRLDPDEMYGEVLTRGLERIRA